MMSEGRTPCSQRRLADLLLLLCACLLAAPAWASEATVAYRSADLPERPQRIVTLDDLSTELVLSLGLTPVGVANLDGYRRWVGLDAERLETSVPLGSAQQPDLEAIVQLRPDLVVGVSYLHAGLFERLDALAPTLLYRVSLAPSPHDAVATGAAMLRHLARLTGREAAAVKVLAEMHAALEAARQTIHEAGLTDKPLAVLYPLTQQGSFVVSNDQTLIVSLVNRLGTVNPWPLHASRRLHRRIGLREVASVPQLTLLFIGGQQNASFFDSPLWQALPVAEQGRYGFLATPYWSFGGPKSATVIARQIAAAVRQMRADE